MKEEGAKYKRAKTLTELNEREKAALRFEMRDARMSALSYNTGFLLTTHMVEMAALYEVARRKGISIAEAYESMDLRCIAAENGNIDYEIQKAISSLTDEKPSFLIVRYSGHWAVIALTQEKGTITVAHMNSSSDSHFTKAAPIQRIIKKVEEEAKKTEKKVSVIENHKDIQYHNCCGLSCALAVAAVMCNDPQIRNIQQEALNATYRSMGRKVFSFIDTEEMQFEKPIPEIERANLVKSGVLEPKEGKDSIAVDDELFTREETAIAQERKAYPLFPYDIMRALFSGGLFPAAPAVLPAVAPVTAPAPAPAAPASTSAASTAPAAKASVSASAAPAKALASTSATSTAPAAKALTLRSAAATSHWSTSTTTSLRPQPSLRLQSRSSQMPQSAQPNATTATSQQLSSNIRPGQYVPPLIMGLLAVARTFISRCLSSSFGRER